VIELPKEFAAKMPDLVARVQRYAQYNKGNLTAAAQQVIGEEFGDPGAQGGFTINRGMGVLAPTITYGNKRQPLPTPATPENYPTPSPYAVKPAPRPAGPPVPPPPASPSPTAAFVPPPPAAPVYKPAGTAPLPPPAPVVAPTIKLGGNPAPPAAVPPPPAPAAPAAPAQAAAPSPNDIISHARAAIAAGADEAAVTARLKKDFNLDLPPLAPPPAVASAPGP
jgi:hypothetical protein